MLGYTRNVRITRGVELQRIAREGKRFRTRHLEVRTAASPLALSGTVLIGCRVGLVVPRFGHTAVARNLVKRRLRELVRIHLIPTAVALDVVLRIRPDAYDISFVDLRGEMLSVIQQLHRWADARSIKHEETTGDVP